MVWIMKNVGFISQKSSENWEFAYRGVDILHFPYDLLRQIQVQIDVLLLAADGVVALAPGTTSHMLTKLSIHVLLLTPRVWQIG